MPCTPFVGDRSYAAAVNPSAAKSAIVKVVPAAPKVPVSSASPAMFGPLPVPLPTPTFAAPRLPGRQRNYGVNVPQTEVEHEGVSKVPDVEMPSRRYSVCEIIPTVNTPYIAECVITNLYVRNIGNIDNETLFNMFSPYGEICYCVVVRYLDGRSKGFGFVDFVHAECAAAAFTALNKTRMPKSNLVITIEPANRQRFHQRPVVCSPQSHMMGAVYPPQPNMMGPAPVCSPQPGMMGGPVCSQQSSSIMSTPRCMTPPLSVIEESSRKNLIVRRLLPDMLEDYVKTLFDPFGSINLVIVQRNEYGFSQGFGYVCFDNEEDAKRAKLGLDSRFVNGTILLVDYVMGREERVQQITNFWLSSRLYHNNQDTTYPHF